MKNNKLTFLKIAIVAVFGVATFVGCEKKDVLQKEQKIGHELKSEISVSDLKLYFGQLSRVDTSKIFYDSNLKKFFIDGKGEISYEELKQTYLISPINNYENGKPSAN